MRIYYTINNAQYTSKNLAKYPPEKHFACPKGQFLSLHHYPFLYLFYA